VIGVRREISIRERNHTMIVGSGLYVLRYVSTIAADDAPLIRVRPSPRDTRGISLFSVPGGSNDSLTSPGECILVRAEKPGALDLTVSSTRPNGSLDAEMRLERIASSDEAVSNRLPGQTRRSAGSASQPDVELLAHVSRRGDVVCEQGEWICGPDLPMAIEGLEIRWPNKPSGVNLRYTVTVGPNRQRLQEAVVGQFAGNRGKAAPIVGLTLALSGPGATDYELRTDALFLGAQIASKNGSQITFAGPTGREPLVGFRMAVVKARNRTEFAQEMATQESVVMKQTGRVRVYRPASVPAPRINGSARA
jgi:hypothetical protein